MARFADGEDTAAIAAMLHEFNLEFSEPSPGPAFLERRVAGLASTSHKAFLLAGEPDREPAGFALIDFRPTVWSEGPVATLEELYVRPNLRGRGHGDELMRLVLDTARKRGCPWIEVVTGESDTAARGIYSKFGFSNDAENGGSTRSLYYELDLSP
jgi:ribosomal protein S18 acetylase RimI-like enzyme